MDRKLKRYKIPNLQRLKAGNADPFQGNSIPFQGNSRDLGRHSFRLNDRTLYSILSLLFIDNS